MTHTLRDLNRDEVAAVAGGFDEEPGCGTNPNPRPWPPSNPLPGHGPWI